MTSKKAEKDKEAKAMKKQGFLHMNYSMFINSFRRISLWFFLIVALDIAFYFILMQAGALFLNILQQKSSGITLDSSLLASAAGVEALSSAIRGFFFFLIASLIALIIFISILSGIIKGPIWSLSSGKKPSMAFMKKFTILSLIWVPSWLALVFIASIGIKQQSAPFFVLGIAVLFVHFSNVLYPVFIGENRISSVRKAFAIGIKKVHYYLIPYLAAIIILYTVSSAYNAISLSLGLNPNIFLLVVVCFVAWLRHYLIEIAGRVSG